MSPAPVPEKSAEDITLLLRSGAEGDAEKQARLLGAVYNEMRRMVRRHMRSEKSGSTLQTTALVHEAYLRLFQRPIDWKCREHFYAVSSQTMRRILVDYARARRAVRRNGGIRAELDQNLPVADDRMERVLHVDQSLDRLLEIQPRAGKVVESHVFVGLSLVEIAEILDVSEKTVKRDWAFAKAWFGEEVVAQRGR